jgi:hypothetical protein
MERLRRNRIVTNQPLFSSARHRPARRMEFRGRRISAARRASMSDISLPGILPVHSDEHFDDVRPAPRDAGERVASPDRKSVV